MQFGPSMVHIYVAFPSFRKQSDRNASLSINPSLTLIYHGTISGIEILHADL